MQLPEELKNSSFCWCHIRHLTSTNEDDHWRSKKQDTEMVMNLDSKYIELFISQRKPS